VQSFQVRRATGDAAKQGAEGELIASGQIDDVVQTNEGVMAFAG
jgi:hypothetical protein